MKKIFGLMLCLAIVSMVFATIHYADKAERPKELKEAVPAPYVEGILRSTGGPDDFGYTWIDSDEPGGPTFNWIEISGTGTPTNLSDDGEYWGIPFSFTFYGVTYDTIGISANGALILFDDDLGYNNQPLPYYSTTYSHIQLICLFWDDMNPASSSSDNIYFEVIGNQLVIEWHDVVQFSQTTPMTFEVILDGNTGDILFQYQDVYDSGSSATVGIQGDTTVSPAWYLQYSYNTASLHDSLAIKFSVPPGFLFVYDDDGGTSLPMWQTSFTNLGYDPAIWVVEDSGGVAPDAVAMSDYDLVAWTTGGDYSGTLTDTDTTEIGTYLNSGGKMWLSSQDALYDIGPASWMHVGSHSNDVGCDTATGIGPVMTGTSFETMGGVFSDYSDICDPDGISWTEMQNETPDNNTIAMDVTGGIPYYLFFNTFGWENITLEADRDTMMQRVVTWLLTSSHDVGVTSINAPPPTMFPNTTIDPSATYENFGSTAETFDVYFMIDSSGTIIYNETANITLDPGDDTTMTFTSWTTGPGDGIVYNITTYTALPYDENPSNDTLVTQTITSMIGAWTQCANMPTPELANATAYDPVNDHVYSFGGSMAGGAGDYQDFTYQYDPVGNIWNTMANMPNACDWIDASYINGKFYVIGGYNGSANNWNMIYDIAGNVWSTGATITQPRHSHQQVVYNDSLIYVLGGRDASGTAHSTVFIYNTYTDTWTTGTSMPTTCHKGGAAIIDNTIYLVGGWNNAGTALSNLYYGVIDPANCENITWSTGSALPYANAAAGVIQGERSGNWYIYMVGGFVNGSTVTDETWEYIVASDLWNQLPDYTPFTIGRNNYAVFRDGFNELYVCGGDIAGGWSGSDQAWKLPWQTGVAEEPGKSYESVAFGFAPMANPTRNHAVISYTITKRGMVSLKVYDRTGRLVETLVNDVRRTGTQTVTWDAANVPNGVYFLRLESENNVGTHKLILVK